MATVQKGDFIKLSYTGKLSNGVVFDTTDANVAKENGIYNEKANYGPETIVVGKGYVVAGLDEDIIGKDVGEKGHVEVAPEKGFGMRRLDLIETIPAKKFKEKVKPGMRVQVQNRTGMVESTAGGRVRINFNPALAGETLTYDYAVDELIEGTDRKIDAIMKLYAGQDIGHKTEGDKVIVEVPRELSYNQRWAIAKSVAANDILEQDDIKEVVFQETYTKPIAPKVEETPAPEEKKE
ncbi:MAG TPA: peptidylprolyl isomerase [Methanocella sp.]|uniref:FKBP-type peptidyl-prolyl cis-trans isomerase n=1 Tax=Methanocella sp. TaxID=2052833 RepID=UPI002B833C3A|nr:peptidylprolyl isomerase [Methanocella sp.]HTY91378.1 peptidylprolyl isomerase [Methanocella sp.]